MPYATALTLLEGGRLEMVEQNALRFHDDIAYDDTYNGLVVDPAEGDRLARVLGTKRVLFLANHGVIVVGPTVAEAFDSLYYLERACRLQVLARARAASCAPCARRGARDLPPDPRRHAEIRRRAFHRAEAHPRPRGGGLFPLSGCASRSGRRNRTTSRRFHAIYSHHVLKGLASFEEVPPARAEIARRYQDVTSSGLPWIVAQYGDRIAGYGYCALYRTRSAYRYSLEDSIYVHHEMHGAA
jgi:hypothetical protein